MNKAQFLAIIKHSVHKGYTLHKRYMYVICHIHIYVYIVIDISGSIYQVSNIYQVQYY